jgi:hypothetical protein
MDNCNTEQLQDAADQVALTENRRNVVSEKTRAQYWSSMGIFISWIIENHRHILLTPFYDYLVDFQAERGSSLKNAIKALIDKSNQQRPPFVANEEFANKFMTWLLGLKTSKGADPSKATYAQHRSAIFFTLKAFKIAVSEDIKDQLTTDFKGLKRSAAARTQAGEGRIKEGKDALS